MLEINKIHQGDCLDIMSEKIDDKSINMILCDLPYGKTQCEWDINIPLDRLWRAYKRILKVDGIVVLTSSQPFTTDLINSNREWFKYCWIWIKSRPTGHLSAKLQPLRAYEEILVFYNKQPTYQPILTEKPTKHIRKNNTKLSLNNINVYGKHDEFVSNRYDKREIRIDKNYPINILYFDSFCRQNMLHPTQKPIELFKYLIKTYTKKGDVVLDNCIGSGTTAVACKELNRFFIGIETNPKFIKITNKRLSQEVLS